MSTYGSSGCGVFVGEPISVSELAEIIEKFQQKTETKSMKPKVNWRCLKTDAPKTDGRYWFAGKSGCVELLWLDSKSYDDDYARGTLDELLRLQWVKWAHYEAPEPPPKPTPFEEWWNSLPDSTLAIGAKAIDGMTISEVTARKCYHVGYADCAKNMVNGGAK